MRAVLAGQHGPQQEAGDDDHEGDAPHGQAPRHRPHVARHGARRRQSQAAPVPVLVMPAGHPQRSSPPQLPSGERRRASGPAVPGPTGRRHPPYQGRCGLGSAAGSTAPCSPSAQIPTTSPDPNHEEEAQRPVPPTAAPGRAQPSGSVSDTVRAPRRSPPGAARRASVRQTFTEPGTAKGCDTKRHMIDRHATWDSLAALQIRPRSKGTHPVSGRDTRWFTQRACSGVSAARGVSR